MGAGMTDTLIARLRSMLKDTCDEAADRIEALQAKIEEHTALCVKRVAEVTRERNQLRARLTALEGQEPVAYVAGAYGGHFTYRTINPAMVLPQNAALFLAAGAAPKADRKAFEAWAEPILGDNLTWKESGECELAWQAWQAAQAAPTKEQT